MVLEIFYNFHGTQHNTGFFNLPTTGTFCVTRRIVIGKKKIYIKKYLKYFFSSKIQSDIRQFTKLTRKKQKKNLEEQ